MDRDEDIEKRLYEDGKSDDYILGYLKGYAQGEYDINQKIKSELEIYKKIANMFGKTLIYFSNKDITIKELLDWARKEVLKDE